MAFDVLAQLRRLAQMAAQAGQQQPGQAQPPAGGLDFGGYRQNPSPSVTTALSQTPTGEVAGDAGAQSPQTAQTTQQKPSGLVFSPPAQSLDFKNPNPAYASAANSPATTTPTAAAGASPVQNQAPAAALQVNSASEVPPDYLPKSLRDTLAQIEALRSAPPPADTPGQSRWGTFGGVVKHALPRVLEQVGEEADKHPTDFGALDFFGPLAAGVAAPATIAARGGPRERATDERMGREANLGRLQLQFERDLGNENAVATVRSKAAEADYKTAEAYHYRHPQQPKKRYMPLPGHPEIMYNVEDPADRIHFDDVPQKEGNRQRAKINGYHFFVNPDGTLDPVIDPRTKQQAVDSNDVADEEGLTPKDRVMLAEHATERGERQQERTYDRSFSEEVSRWDRASHDVDSLVRAIAEMNHAIAMDEWGGDASQDWNAVASTRKGTVMTLATGLRSKYGDLLQDDDKGWPTQLKTRPVYSPPAPEAAPAGRGAKHRPSSAKDPLGLYQ